MLRSSLFLSCLLTAGATAHASGPLWPGAPLVAAQFDGGFAIHGVAGDQVLLFALVPSASPDQAPGVYVRKRVGGADAGALEAPSDGWAVPLTMKITSFERGLFGSTRGRALVLDTRVPPALAGSQPSRVYEYEYRYTLLGGLTSRVIAEHTLPLNTVAPGTGLPDGFVYPGSLALLPGGAVAATDVLTGALWVSDDLDDWRLAAIDPRWAGAPYGTVHGVGRAQSGAIEPYELLTPAPPGFPPGLGLYPGAHSIAYAARTREVVFAVTIPGGIYALPLDVLLDTATPPFAKGASARLLVPPTYGLGDLTDGVDYDRFHPGSVWVYWQRAPADVAGGGKNTLRRVSLTTGEIQVVASDNSVYSWANEISVLPPLVAGSPLTTVLSSVGQEYNNPDVNALLLGVPRYFAPSRMPIVVVGQ